MTIKHFSSLTPAESDQLLQAPAVIAVLIAGADQNIDKKEKDWATRLVQYRTFTADPRLHQYYELVSEDFEEELHQLTDAWNAHTTEGQLVARLSVLKDILAKIDAEYAALLKASWRSMATKIAEASGGLVGFGSISKHEARLVELEMLG